VTVLAASVPLVLRRIRPMEVFGWEVLLAAGSGWWTMQGAWSTALPIALYTVAVSRPRWQALMAAGLLTVGAVIGTAHVFPEHWYTPAASLIGAVIATTVLGLYIRTRRDLFDQLRARADSLERDRRQQAALAAAAERARIAREMHDIVAHHLTVMVTLADGAVAAMASRPEQAEDTMRNVASTGRLALRDTRRLLGVLREDDANTPRVPLPTVAEIDDLIARVRAAGLDVSYAARGEVPQLVPALQVAVYRIVQEGLTNTMKHAGGGARASVRIEYAPDEVRVDITDDGTGTGGPADGSGRGLIGIRERVQTCGGELRTGPVAPRGWAVSARLPLTEREPS
jgi:signal transduction histidine kinase